MNNITDTELSLSRQEYQPMSEHAFDGNISQIFYSCGSNLHQQEQTLHTPQTNFTQHDEQLPSTSKNCCQRNKFSRGVVTVDNTEDKIINCLIQHIENTHNWNKRCFACYNGIPDFELHNQSLCRKTVKTSEIMSVEKFIEFCLKSFIFHPMFENNRFEIFQICESMYNVKNFIFPLGEQNGVYDNLKQLFHASLKQLISKKSYIRI